MSGLAHPLFDDWEDSSSRGGVKNDGHPPAHINVVGESRTPTVTNAIMLTKLIKG